MYAIDMINNLPAQSFFTNEESKILEETVEFYSTKSYFCSWSLYACPTFNRTDQKIITCVKIIKEKGFSDRKDKNVKSEILEKAATIVLKSAIISAKNRKGCSTKKEQFYLDDSLLRINVLYQKFGLKPRGLGEM